MLTANGNDTRRVVARYADGRILKGTTQDFSPQKERFHLHPSGSERAPAVQVALAELKALFFVRSFEGDPKHVESDGLEEAKGQGRRVRVTFNDGEVIAGFTMGFSGDKPGFFLLPSDLSSNNLRIFVVRLAVRKLEWLAGPVAAATAR